MPVAYPSLLRPTTTESLTGSGQVLTVPKVELQLRPWLGDPIHNTFGNKPLIDFGGRPVFAELCVYELFRLAGWQARWVETYGAGAMTPHHFTAWAEAGLAGQQHDPIPDPAVQDLLHQMAQANGNSYAGCWDVVGWNGGSVVFAELKRLKKDRIRATQPRWAEAGLQVGLQSENFLLVEWDFAGV
ncbi:hypothetical protein GCM10023185_36510 [Hymenobacter saemangeumensis]|uniref:VRR-NUC domain-containing protein n=1 Tax=Hymenobacter saemangeumensis TaxID=1084522 RepID=A0ABP8IQY6_9BACT